MNCPYPGFADHKVLDSRPAREGEAIRRRRECLRCERRFTTFESSERPKLLIVKRSGTREEFSAEKYLKSMLICMPEAPLSHSALRAQGRRLGELTSLPLEQYAEDEAPSTSVGDRCP